MKILEEILNNARKRSNKDLGELSFTPPRECGGQVISDIVSEKFGKVGSTVLWTTVYCNKVEKHLKNLATATSIAKC